MILVDAADEVLVRGVLVAPLALLLPFASSRLRSRLTRSLIAVALTLAALSAFLDEAEAWVIILVAAALAAALPGQSYERRPLLPVLAALAAGVAAALTGAAATWDAITTVAKSEGLVIVAAGGLLCVFVGGAVIGRVMHPFAEKVNAQPRGMEAAGRYIGWLERSLLYGLVVIGSADGAALVIAAKSVARFPSFKREEFAEYYLIGSLLSLLVAAACGLGARAAIGQPLM